MLSNNKTFDNSNIRDLQKTFNDGICYIYEANERTLIKSKGFFHFSKETVGIGIYYESNVNGISIDMAIGIPLNDIIQRLDIAKINDEFFRITNIQRKDNKKPNYLKIFLERDGFEYETNGL